MKCPSRPLGLMLPVLCMFASPSLLLRPLHDEVSTVSFTCTAVLPAVEFEGPPPEPWDEPSNDPRVINSAHGSPKVSGGGRFVVARRSRWTPLAAGQELLLCYGDGLSNRQLLLK